MTRQLKGDTVLKHIRCAQGDIAPYVITPGDPARAERIAGYMDDARLMANNREYVVYTGTYKDIPLTVCSSGIGGPAASIAFEELIKLGAKVIIRVGSAGGRQPDIPIGTPVVITASYRGEGTSKAYLPSEFPAVADLETTVALVDALRQANIPHRTGIGFCRDAYYVQDAALNALLTDSGVVVAEQEASILFIIGSVRNIKTGAIVATDSNILLFEQPTIEEKEALYMKGEALAIQAALDAVVDLAHASGE